MIERSEVDEEFKIELSYENVEKLKSFSLLLDQDINTLLNKALSEYFKNEEKRMIEKQQEDDSMMTNLDFDEFWDGVNL